MIYFSSDQHFWHQNVIKYCVRPYFDVEQMNEDMILKWNSIVGPDDDIYVLGDFSLAFRPVETYSKRLMGKKKLVPGNHDWCHSYHKKSRTEENKKKWTARYEEHGWEVLPEQHMLEIPGVGSFNLCHHPYLVSIDGSDKYERWRPFDDGRILLCGHVHEKWRTKKSEEGTLMINVGVDVHDFTPVSTEQIGRIISENNT